MRAFAYFYEKCELTNGIGNHDLLSVVDIDAVGWIVYDLTIEIVVYAIGGSNGTLRYIFDICRTTVRNEPYAIHFQIVIPVNLQHVQMNEIVNTCLV